MDEQGFWESGVALLPATLFTDIKGLLCVIFEGLPVQVVLRLGKDEFRHFTPHQRHAASELFQRVYQEMTPSSRVDSALKTVLKGAKNQEESYCCHGIYDSNNSLCGLLYVQLPSPFELTDIQLQSIHLLANQAGQLLDSQRLLYLKEKQSQAYQQRAEQLHNIIEATNMGTWELNVQTQELKFNERWAGMLGYTSQELQPISINTWYAVLHPDDRAYAEQELFACANDQIEFYDIACRLLHKDGSIVWVNDRGSVISRSLEGTPICLAGTHTYITEKHEANLREKTLAKELADRNFMIESTLNHLPIGIAIYDNQQFRTTLINKRFSQYLGWPKEDIFDLAALIEKLYPDPEYRQKVIEKAGQGITNGDPSPVQWAKLEITTSTGARRFIDASNINLPGMSLSISTVVDVTQQHLQELEIQRVKSNQEALINATDDLVWSLDLSGRIQACNKAFSNTVEALSNIKIAEGDSVYFAGLAPEALKKWEGYYRRCASGQSFKILEEAFDPIYKIPIYYHVSFQPIYDDKGKVRALACYSKNITNERNHQLQILKNRDELGKIMNMSLDIICTIDTNGYFVKVSKACLKTWGYAPAELVGTHYMDYVLEEDLVKTRDSENLLRRGLPITDFQNRYKCKDGSIVPMAWSVIENQQDKLCYCVARNITDRKVAEDNLRRSEQHFKALVQEGSDLIAIIDIDGKYRYVSPSTTRVLGIAPDFFINKNAIDFVHPDDQFKAKEALKSVASMRSVNLAPLRFQTKGQGWRWIETVLTNLLDDPTVQGLVVNSRDITEHIQSEKALEESIERFEKVAEATNDAIWDWDVEQNSMYWGGGFKHLFGYQGQQHPQTIEGCHKRIHPDDVKGMTQIFYSALDDKNTNKFQYEYRFQKSDGSYVLVIDRGVIIRNNEGQAKRVVGAMTDISYRREFEEALQRLNADLQQHTKELEQSNAELEQFAYIASHDLQEPLRMVTSFLSQLEKKYEGQLDARAQKYIYYAVDGATRMRQIILDLLEYSRAGRKDSSPEIVNLNQIIVDYRILRKKTLQETDAMVVASNLPSISAIKAPLTQILYNLIDNGIKYSKNNLHPLVQISVMKDDQFWEFAVKDNGIGIAPEYFGKIFELFQRLHPNSEYSGTGIGLAIVKKIIDNLNGKIWIESLVNHGSTFYFTIPKYGGHL